MFKLKKGQEAFTPVEGPFAGRKFVAGQIYGEIPPGTAGKFEEIKKAAPVKAEGKKAVEWIEPDDPRRKPAKGEAPPHAPADAAKGKK